MKKILLLLSLCFAGFWAQAQTFAVNDTLILRPNQLQPDTIYLLDNDAFSAGISTSGISLSTPGSGTWDTIAYSSVGTFTYISSASTPGGGFVVFQPSFSFLYWQKTQFINYSWQDNNGMAAGAQLVILPMQVGCEFTIDSAVTTPAICGGYEGSVELVGHNLAGNIGAFDAYLGPPWNSYYDSSANMVLRNVSPRRYLLTARVLNNQCQAVSIIADVTNLGLHPPISAAVSVSCSSYSTVTLSSNTRLPVLITGPYAYSETINSFIDTILPLNRFDRYFFTDANGCSGIGTFQSSFSIPSAVSVTQTSIGGVSVSLSAYAPPGIVVNRYTWHNNSSNTYSYSPSITALVGDVIRVGISANHLSYCSVSLVTTVTANNSCNLSITSVIDSTTAGQGFCRINLSPSGGTVPYSALWPTGQLGINVTLTIGQLYFPTVTDANGCSTIIRVDTRNMCPSRYFYPSFASACTNPFQNVSVTLNFPWLFQHLGPPVWSNGAVGYQIQTTPRSIVCSVTDINGCMTTGTFNVVDPNRLDSVRIRTNPTCRNGSTGLVFVSTFPSYQQPSYSFGTSWPVAPGLFNSVRAGSYILTVTMQGGCTSTYPFTVEETPISFVNNITPTSCSALSNGSVFFGPRGHLNSWFTTYSLNGISVTGNAAFGNLPSGTHVMNYYDRSNGCADTVSVFIPQDSLHLNANPIPACNGISNGAVNLFPSTSTGPSIYTYRWSNGSTTPNLQFVRPGAYSVTVTERSGCTATTTQQVGAITAWVGIAGSPYICPNVPTVLRASSTGGANYYTWTPGNISSQNLQAQGAGLHTVFMTTPNGCTASASMNLTATPTCLNLPPVTRTDTIDIAHDLEPNTPRILDFGDVLTNDFDPEGLPLRYTFSIVRNGVHGTAYDNGSGNMEYILPNTFRSLDSIAYLVCEDVPGGLCSSATMVIRMQDCDFRFQQNVASSCGQDGALTVTSTNGAGPFSYQSNGIPQTTPNVAVFTNLSPGPQYFWISTPSGCLDSVFVNIPYRRSTNVQVLSSPPSCTRDYLDVTITGGSNVRWSDGLQSRVRRINRIGDLVVTVRDGGCQFIDTVRYIPFLSTNVAKIVNCSTGEESLTVTANSTNGGPYTYLWNNNANSPNVTLAPGLYTYTVTDAGGCARGFSYSVNSQNNFYASIAQIASDTCGLGRGALRASLLQSSGSANSVQQNTPTNLLFAWNNGQQSATVSGLRTGQYSVTITDSLGCVYEANTMLSALTRFTASVQTTPTSCQQPSGEASLRINGRAVMPMRYAWDDGSFGATAQNLSSGSHQVTIEDASGCASIQRFNIGNAAHFSVETTQSNTLCGQPNSGSATALLRGIPQGAVTYTWSNGAIGNTINGLGLGSYVVSVSDASGCQQIAVVNINESQPFDLNVMKANAACQTSSGSAQAVVTGNPNGTLVYRWDNGTPTLVDFANGLSLGLHALTATDAAGCSQTLVYEINAQQSFVINNAAAITHSLCGAPNGAIVLDLPIVNISYGSISYRWDNNYVGSNPSGLSPDVYTATATDGACTDVATFVVNDRDWLQPFVATSLVNCANANSGSATVTLPAALAGLTQTFVWSNGATTSSVASFPEGSYSLVARVGNTCMGHANFQISRDPNCIVQILGKVVDDEQNRTCSPQGQTGIAGKLVRCLGPNGYQQHDYTDPFGNYGFNAPEPGTYTIDLLNSWTPYELPWQPICGATRSVTLTNYGEISYDNNFYMELVDSVQNLVTLATSTGTARPGVDRPYRISSVNLGGSAATGQTAFTWDPNLDNYVNLSQVPNSGLNVLNRTVSYDFAQLPSGSSRNFDFNLTVPIGVPLNTLLSSTAVSQPLAGDDYPLNNYFLYSQVVTNSYDPNDKHANLGRALTQADSTLVYTIRFQNTGNDTAYTVVVRDTLDANVFDVLTATAIDASHAYKLHFLEPNVLEFRFENIMLVDSFRNEPASNGFITFAIRLKPNLPYGTFFRNKAAIFFDFNDPIITNTAINELVDPNGITEVGEAPTLTIYPNPSSSSSTLRFDLRSGSDNVVISVFDALGREYWQQQSTAVAGANLVEIPELPDGVWFVKYSDGKNTATRTLVSKK